MLDIFHVHCKQGKLFAFSLSFSIHYSSIWSMSHDETVLWDNLTTMKDISYVSVCTAHARTLSSGHFERGTELAVTSG